MHNDSETQYQALQEALAPSFPVLEQAVDTILDQEVSAYPILLLHQAAINLGVPIVAGQVATAWSVSASTLEELVTKQVVTMDKVDRFQQVYKDPRKTLCLLVLSDQQVEFVFLPRVTPASDPAEEA